MEHPKKLSVELKPNMPKERRIYSFFHSYFSNKSSVWYSLNLIKFYWIFKFSVKSASTCWNKKKLDDMKKQKWSRKWRTRQNRRGKRKKKQEKKSFKWRKWCDKMKHWQRNRVIKYSHRMNCWKDGVWRFKRSKRKSRKIKWNLKSCPVQGTGFDFSILFYPNRLSFRGSLVDKI